MPDLIHPVLMCGGSGTRLWPLSRKSYPKQFAALVGDQSLFQTSAQRFAGPGFAPPVVVTAADFRFIVGEQLQAAGVKPAAIVLEPMARNTAAAVCAASLLLARRDAGALVLVAPSDHAMPDGAGFADAVRAAVPAARAGQIVTFGIAPDRAETGYGWLELSGPVTATTAAPMPLVSFVEKPDAARAALMLAEGRHLWNAGIFLFSAATMLAAFQTHAPDILGQVTAALDNAAPDLDFLRLAEQDWSALHDISVDYAVMERAENLSVMPYAGPWSDLGDWEAVWRATHDAGGMATSGAVLAIECQDSILRAETPGQQLVGIGLSGMIAVAMPDAVLVAPRDQAQAVKRAVETLRAAKSPQADTFPRDHRPWGWFERLVSGDRFQVKRIVVHPGAALSMQSHVHRAEHWVVVQGTAQITVDGVQKLVTENESIYVPLGAKHRLENPGKVEVVLIEVQSGRYLGEDDITRYEDLYARKPQDGG